MYYLRQRILYVSKFAVLLCLAFFFFQLVLFLCIGEFPLQSPSECLPDLEKGFAAAYILFFVVLFCCGVYLRIADLRYHHNTMRNDNVAVNDKIEICEDKHHQKGLNAILDEEDTYFVEKENSTIFLLSVIFPSLVLSTYMTYCSKWGYCSKNSVSPASNPEDCVDLTKRIVTQLEIAGLIVPLVFIVSRVAAWGWKKITTQEDVRYRRDDYQYHHPTSLIICI